MNWIVEMFWFNRNNTLSNAERVRLLDDDNIIINPIMHSKANEAGSFDFVILPNHEQYSSIDPYACYIEIFYKGKLKWRGRIEEYEEDMYGAKTVHCSGELSFLNDTVQFARRNGGTAGDAGVVEMHYTSVSRIIDCVLTIHNAGVQVDGSNNYRDMLFRTTTASNKYYDQYAHEYGSTLDIIKQFTEKFGLYSYIKRAKGGISTLFLAGRGQYLEDSGINVAIGENIVAYSSKTSEAVMYNAIVPRGSLRSYNDDKSGAGGVSMRYIETLPYTTDGSYFDQIIQDPYITGTDTRFVTTDESQQAIAKYGHIYRFERNENLSSGTDVTAWAKSVLNAMHTNPGRTNPYIKTTVANIDAQNNDIFNIDLGYGAHVTCESRGINNWLMPLTEITVDLSNPAVAEMTFGNEIDESLAYEVM